MVARLLSLLDPAALYLALKYLKPKRSFVSVVTAISVLGVLLGVAVLVIVRAVFTGFGDMWNEKILSFKPHLTVYGRFGAIEEVDEACRLAESVPGVTGAAPVVYARTLMQFQGRAQAPVLVGIDPARAGVLSRVPEHLTSGAFDLEENRIVLGRDLAMRLGLLVGDVALVHSPMGALSQNEFHLPEEMAVAGIYNMGMRDFDADFVLASIDVVRDLVGLESGAHVIYVMTDDPQDFEARQAALEAALGPSYLVRTWRDEDQVLFSALRLEKTMMTILLVFISVVAIFCVTNTLIVITVQKTHEIGLLRALGFRSRTIMGVFVWHGWIQCLAGTLAGIGTALLVLRNLKPITDFIGRVRGEDLFPKEIYGLDAIPWRISTEEVAWVAVCVMVLCTVSSLLPAWRAARMDPVEALRHE